MDPLQIQQKEDYLVGHFHAMASPCQVLIDTQDPLLANHLGSIALKEAKRIEQKLSRYRKDNIIYKINHSDGKKIKVDKECAQMLDYAAQCFNLSDGLFDVTSGILRKAWTFDCSDKIPDKREITRLLSRIGWKKVRWKSPFIQLPKGMEIDFGGIGKEYSVDRTLLLLKETSNVSCLVNYGGDIAISGPRQSGKGWMVGIENPGSASGSVDSQTKVFELKQGAMATSGDANRFLLKDGIRYSHILDPRTGWPVTNAPRSVTVITDTCTEAGILATLAMLHGAQAEEFLKQQDIKYWSVRD